MANYVCVYKIKTAVSSGKCVSLLDVSTYFKPLLRFLEQNKILKNILSATSSPLSLFLKNLAFEANFILWFSPLLDKINTLNMDGVEVVGSVLYSR